MSLFISSFKEESIIFYLLFSIKEGSWSEIGKSHYLELLLYHKLPLGGTITLAEHLLVFGYIKGTAQDEAW